MAWRMHIALGALAAAVLASCGGGWSGQVPGDVWSRHDDPPADVAPTVSDTAAPLGAICGEERSEIQLDRRPSEGDRGRLPARQPELGDTLQVCPPHPDDERPVTLTVRRSDGSEVSKTIAPYAKSISSDVGYFGSFFLDASWPLGPARVTARQGAMVRRTTFVVAPPRGHGVRVAQWFGRPALPNPVPIMVVGPPRTTVLVDLYSARGLGSANTYNYARTLRVATDARGIGQVRIGYDRADNGGYEVAQRGAGTAEHISICVACCEEDLDESGSLYCAG